jgi:hypothetical protein
VCAPSQLSICTASRTGLTLCVATLTLAVVALSQVSTCTLPPGHHTLGVSVSLLLWCVLQARVSTAGATLHSTPCTGCCCTLIVCLASQVSICTAGGHHTLWVSVSCCVALSGVSTGPKGMGSLTLCVATLLVWYSRYRASTPPARTRHTHSLWVLGCLLLCTLSTGNLWYGLRAQLHMPS